MEGEPKNPNARVVVRGAFNMDTSLEVGDKKIKLNAELAIDYGDMFGDEEMLNVKAPLLEKYEV